MQIIAWRGGIENGNENTIKAIKFSLKWADIIEVDVRMTSDKKLVLSHSPRFENLFIRKHKLSELKKKGEINELYEALDLVTPKKALMIDLKDKGLERFVLNEIRNYKLENIIINSLQKDILFKVRRLNKRIKISVGFGRKAGNLTYIRKVVDKLSPYCLAIFKSNMKVIRFVKSNFKVKTFVWLIKKFDELKNLMDCDGIITPFPMKLSLKLRKK